MCIRDSGDGLQVGLNGRNQGEVAGGTFHDSGLDGDEVRLLEVGVNPRAQALA